MGNPTACRSGKYKELHLSANASIPVKDSEGNVTGFKNNAAVRQHSGNIQIFTAMLQQKLKVGIFHLDGEVAYQKIK